MRTRPFQLFNVHALTCRLKKVIFDMRTGDFIKLDEAGHVISACHGNQNTCSRRRSLAGWYGFAVTNAIHSSTTSLFAPAATKDIPTCVTVCDCISPFLFISRALLPGLPGTLPLLHIIGGWFSRKKIRETYRSKTYVAPE